MDKLGLKDLSLKGKRVLMRVDFNVPLKKDGTISDDSRIQASLHSIQYILSQGASLVLMSHLGRPKGSDPALSLNPCAKRLSELLHREVLFVPDCIGPEVKEMVSKLVPGQVLLLENLRFHAGEEKTEIDPGFVKSLAQLGDVYVNDAFGTAHRAHASTALIAKYFPGKAAAGFLMEKEIEALGALLNNPKRPFYAILGGAKVSTKIGLIKNLLKLVDGLFLGGGMAFTFMKAKGIEIGQSLFEPDCLDIASEILKEEGCTKLHFPLDLNAQNQGKSQLFPESTGIPEGWKGMDVGPETVKEWGAILKEGATVFWNGPVGVFEIAGFEKGTYGLAEILAQSKGKVIVGGGDSVAAIEQAGLGSRFFHLSTGGGASLEFLEFGHLPGIDALSNKE